MENEENKGFLKGLYDKIDDQTKGQVAGIGTEVAAGLALDAKTQGLLGLGPWGWLGYGVTNFIGGAGANIAAQKMRGEENIKPGEVISSGLLGVIPGTSLRFAKPITKVVGEANTVKRAATFGATQGLTDQVIQKGIDEKRLPTPSEAALGLGVGGVVGGGLKHVQLNPDESGKLRIMLGKVNDPNRPSYEQLVLEPFQSNKYQRSVLSKMNEFGMGDGVFRMKAYKASQGIYAGTNKSRELLESYLSPDKLKGNFQAYKSWNKTSWEYKWGAFLQKKGYNLKQGIQVHHINPLYDSIHLFDGVKFNSKEYWELMDTLIKKNARPGAIQKGDDINNLMMTLGYATDPASPHGIAHKFYNDFTPTFFSKTEMNKINTVPGYRIKKAKRWAALVNKSEELILEAHKQWSTLNPEIGLSFDELITEMSKYNDLGYNKLINPKYQLPDIAKIVQEIANTKGKRGPKTKIENTLKRLFPEVDPKTGDVQLKLDL